MAQVRDNCYVMSTLHDHSSSIYGIDTGTRDVNLLTAYNGAANIVNRGNIVVTLNYEVKATVISDRIKTGHIDAMCKCKNACGYNIFGRYCQQLIDDIYVVDKDSKLWRIYWHDIEARRYDAKCLIDVDVEDFYMHEHGNAILKTTGIIALSGGQSINMQDVAGSVRWSTVTRAANRWIVSGGENNDVCEGYCDKYYDSTSTIASVDDRGVGISSMSIRTTAVAYSAFIKYLKTAIVRGDRAIILAIEVSACCHLISMTASGRLHMIESMPSICKPDVEYCSYNPKRISSMTETDIKGQYIVAGYMWIRKLTVRLN